MNSYQKMCYNGCMHTRLMFGIGVIMAAGFLSCSVQPAESAPVALNTNLQIRLVMYTTNSSGGNSVRIAKDPRDNQFYYLRFNGDIYHLNLQPGGGSTSTRVYSFADYGTADSAWGMAIGPDGTIYVVTNTSTNQGNNNIGRVVKGVPNGNGGRVWSVLGHTQPYPKSRTAFDHSVSGIVVSPDGAFIYLNSGSRTDHGEVESASGFYPDLRETALTAKIFRLPANGANLLLTNDLTGLRSAGYIFAEGTR